MYQPFSTSQEIILEISTTTDSEHSGFGSTESVHWKTIIHYTYRSWQGTTLVKVFRFFWIIFSSITEVTRYSQEFSCVKKNPHYTVFTVALTCNWNNIFQSNKSFIVIVIVVQNYHMQLHVRTIIQFKGIFSILVQASLIAMFAYVVLYCSKKLWY